MLSAPDEAASSMEASDGPLAAFVTLFNSPKPDSGLVLPNPSPGQRQLANDAYEMLAADYILKLART
jgi:hypothetical protein